MGYLKDGRRDLNDVLRLSDCQLHCRVICFGMEPGLNNASILLWSSATEVLQAHSYHTVNHFIYCL